MPTPDTARIATLYLKVHSVVLTLLVLAALAVGLAEFTAGQRLRFPEPIDAVLLVLFAAPTLLLVAGNAILVVWLTRRISRQRGRVRWTGQLEILGTLLPWVGIHLYRKLLRDHSATGAASARR